MCFQVVKCCYYACNMMFSSNFMTCNFLNVPFSWYFIAFILSAFNVLTPSFLVFLKYRELELLMFHGGWISSYVLKMKYWCVLISSRTISTCSLMSLSLFYVLYGLMYQVLYILLFRRFKEML